MLALTAVQLTTLVSLWLELLSCSPLTLLSFSLSVSAYLILIANTNVS